MGIDVDRSLIAVPAVDVVIQLEDSFSTGSASADLNLSYSDSS